ncbi:hypothetical protein BGZ73_004645 [Actinomortierella ambigua]|nr:hypothetical protein BGZ73_004645 [Actinomortierella ambigua]
MEHTSASPNLEFFPELSYELRPLKDSIEVQLEELENFLADYEWFLLLKTETSARKLTSQFLDIVHQYLNETLPDLFESIECIRRLARTYNRSFDKFASSIPRTIREVEACIGYVMALLNKHSETIHHLSDLAQEINRQIGVFKNKAYSHIEGSNAAKTTSISLIIGGVATIGVRALSAVQPIVALGAGFIASSGGIATILANYHQNQAKTYTDAIQQLHKIEMCRSEFETPVRAIHDKLDFCRRRLADLQNDTSTVGDMNEFLDVRRESYEMAKQEAQTIMNVCDEIQQNTSRIRALTSLLSSRAKQLA